MVLCHLIVFILISIKNLNSVELKSDHTKEKITHIHTAILGSNY